MDIKRVRTCISCAHMRYDWEYDDDGNEMWYYSCDLNHEQNAGPYTLACEDHTELFTRKD